VPGFDPTDTDTDDTVSQAVDAAAPEQQRRRQRPQPRRISNPAVVEREINALRDELITDHYARGGQRGKLELRIERISPAYLREQLEAIELDPHDPWPIAEIQERDGPGGYRITLWYARKMQAEWIGVTFPGIHRGAAPSSSPELAPESPAASTPAAAPTAPAAAAPSDLTAILSAQLQTGLEQLRLEQRAEIERLRSELLGAAAGSPAGPPSPLSGVRQAADLIREFRELGGLFGEQPAGPPPRWTWTGSSIA